MWRSVKTSILLPSPQLNEFLDLFLGTELRRIASALLFSLFDQPRSGYSISHSAEDWSAADHWGVQSRPCLSLHFSLFIRLSFYLDPSLTPIPDWEKLLSNTCQLQANECHHSAKKVITPSSPLTPRAQIEPFVVYIKAITLPHVWDRVGGEDRLLDDRLLLSSSLPQHQIPWHAVMMVLHVAADTCTSVSAQVWGRQGCELWESH